MATIIDGKELSKKLKEQMKDRVAQMRQQGIVPKLVVVLVGNNSASEVYVRNKHKACGEVGIESEVIKMPEETTQQELLDVVKGLNEDRTVDGILVQLPLPAHLDTGSVLERILPEKDVDGFHLYNAGALLTGRPGFLPCTPKGIVHLVKSTGVEIAGKRCVVVGRSNIVGKPVALLMLREDATVTICHSRSQDLGSITREADILISAVGRAKLITADMVKPGAVVIDVGQVRLEGKWQGDVDYAPVLEKAAYITPVPGGVGPMTIAMLMENTVEAAEAASRNA